MFIKPGLILTSARRVALYTLRSSAFWLICLCPIPISIPTSDFSFCTVLICWQMFSFGSLKN